MGNVAGQEVREIEVGRLVAHPMNANVLSAGGMGKLRRHIARTGRYEPLVVRVHPTLEGKFELINGHHRKRVLEGLGYEKVACLVWELTDAETLLLLATVNRLSGKDAGEKRVALLEAIGEGMAVAEMVELLPEEEGALRRVLERDAKVEVRSGAVEEMPEAFTVFLAGAEKRRLVAALRRTDRDVGRALMVWAGERDAMNMTR